MMALVKKYFSKNPGGRGKEQGSDVHDPAVALCALFLEMAHIDGEFSESEKERILSMMKSEYGLSHGIVEEFMAAARKEREQSIDLWHFTNLINQNYSPEEKTNIIEMFWKVAYADGKLDSHEDYLLHKLAELLRLSHTQLIEAKLKVKGQEP
jgi:uncharacterized tellurite resistance protein B-like protein